MSLVRARPKTIARARLACAQHISDTFGAFELARTTQSRYLASQSPRLAETRAHACASQRQSESGQHRSRTIAQQHKYGIDCAPLRASAADARRRFARHSRSRSRSHSSSRNHRRCTMRRRGKLISINIITRSESSELRASRHAHTRARVGCGVQQNEHHHHHHSLLSHAHTHTHTHTQSGSVILHVRASEFTQERQKNHSAT